MKKIINIITLTGCIIGLASCNQTSSTSPGSSSSSSTSTSSVGSSNESEYIKKLILIVTIPNEIKSNQFITIGSTLNSWTPSDVNFRFGKKGDKLYSITLDIDTSKGDVKVKYKYTIQDPNNTDQWKQVEKQEDGKTEIDDRTVLISQTGPKKVEINDTVLKFADPNYVQPSTVVGKLTLIEDFKMPQFDDNRTRTIRVWTPLSYNKDDKTKKYSVIYMQDAQNLFDTKTAYAGEWEVDEAIEKLIEDKKSDGAIIVGIDNSSDRMNEYTPNLIDTPNALGGKYGDFIVETLKPYIDLNFNTLSDREHTGIAGSSMGGLISFYTGLRHMETFGMIGAFSSSFQINTKEARQKFIKDLDLSKPLPRLYIDAGKQETLWTYIEPVTTELFVEGYDKNLIYSSITENHGHNETAWRSRFPSAFSWLTGNENGNYEQADCEIKFQVTLAKEVMDYLDSIEVNGDFYIYTGQISASYKLIKSGDMLITSAQSKLNDTFAYQVVFYKEGVITLFETDLNGINLEPRTVKVSEKSMLINLNIKNLERKEKVVLTINVPAKTEQYFNSLEAKNAKLIAYTGSLANSLYPTKISNEEYEVIFFSEKDTKLNFIMLYYGNDVEIYENKADGSNISGTSYNIGNTGITNIKHIVEGWQVQVKLTVNVTSPAIEVPEKETLVMGLYGGVFGGSWRNSQMTTLTPTTFTIEKVVASGEISLTAGYILFKENASSPYDQVFEKEDGKTKSSSYDVKFPFSNWDVNSFPSVTINHTINSFN